MLVLGEVIVCSLRRVVVVINSHGPCRAGFTCGPGSQPGPSLSLSMGRCPMHRAGAFSGAPWLPCSWLRWWDKSWLPSRALKYPQCPGQGAAPLRKPGPQAREAPGSWFSFQEENIIIFHSSFYSFKINYFKSRSNPGIFYSLLIVNVKMVDWSYYRKKN